MRSCDQTSDGKTWQVCETCQVLLTCVQDCAILVLSPYSVKKAIV